MHNPVSLPVFGFDLEFGLHLVCRSAVEMQSHGGAPPAQGSIQRRRKISIRRGGQLPFNGHDRVIVIVAPAITALHMQGNWLATKRVEMAYDKCVTIIGSLYEL